MNTLSRTLPSLLALLLFVAACGPQDEPAGGTSTAGATPAPTPASASAPADGDAPFAFDAPEASLPLPEELKEISGLTVLADGRLAAVQDEVGTLYVLDAASGAVQERVPFEAAGDYEGIERVGDRLFALRSNGALVALSGWASGSPTVERFDTPLKGKNDTEGLAYDAAGNRLLVVTKEDPGAGLDEDLKAIYAFDLSTNTMAETPVYTLDPRTFEDRLRGKGKFKPSALAVHPSSGELYVLSSVSKAVVVLGPDGALRHVWPLAEATYEQPEGLAFLPDGDLVISSEGVDGPAMLHRLTAMH